MDERHAVWRVMVLSLATLAACTAACERSWATPPPTAVTPHSTPLPLPEPAKKTAVKAASVNPAERAWWNQPEVITALQLKDEQRAKMDALLAQSLDAQRSVQAKQREPQKAMQEALATGDWTAARKAAAEQREAVATLWTSQSNLKIDVLALLTPTQQQAVAAQYRQLLRQPSVFWIAPRSPGRTPAAERQ